MGAVTAERLAGLGYPVLGWSRTSKTMAGVATHHSDAGLRTVLAESDALVNLLPLTGETRGLLNADFFARMKRGSYLIQMGRGPHLIEADLIAAVDSGHLAGASLDVFEEEPLPPEHPFWAHPRLLVTPHCASDVSRALVARQTLAAARAALAGEPVPNAVDKTAGY
jgi:glyoxylate/hydroxypyruvate reductase A